MDHDTQAEFDTLRSELEDLEMLMTLEFEGIRREIRWLSLGTFAALSGLLVYVWLTRS